MLHVFSPSHFWKTGTLLLLLMFAKWKLSACRVHPCPLLPAHSSCAGCEFGASLAEAERSFCSLRRLDLAVQYNTCRSEQIELGHTHIHILDSLNLIELEEFHFQK